jgi:hypothetical protein
LTVYYCGIPKLRNFRLSISPFYFSPICLRITHVAEPFSRSRQLCSYSRTSQHFMEPECSLPCSQEPSSRPYPEPNKSNQYHTILYLSLSLTSILILSTHLLLGLPSSLFLLAFHQYPICIPLLRYSCYLPYPSHPPWLDHSNYTWRRVQVMNLLIMQFICLHIR